MRRANGHINRLVLGLIAAMGLCGLASADDLKMATSAAFEGYSPSFGTVPVAVNLSNDGPDAKGVLQVSGGKYQMDFPVELPHGSRKRLLTFPTMDYGSIQYRLMTDRGRVVQDFQLQNGSNPGQTVLLISDAPGALAFIRETHSDPNGSQTSIQDAYTSVDLAPNRPVGYANLAAVILGEGSERLGDDQVDALRIFALTGGTLLFVGGASAPVLADSRWHDVLPASEFHTATLNGSDVLAELGGQDVPPLTVTTGRTDPGTISRRDNGTLITAERGFGLGKVVYCSFNPFEPPISKWDGRKIALPKILRLTDSMRSQSALLSYSADIFSDSRSFTPSGPPSTVATASKYMPTDSGASSDPFSTRLPPVEKVLTILVLYFVLVVPVNFLVLRKLRRGELAWFTAPIISLGFAGVFLASAQNLYSAKMSSASQGIVVGRMGEETGMFIGKTQIFVPVNGSYDLKLSGVDSLGVVSGLNNSFGSDEEQSEINPIDVGEIQAPNMQANNLAFKELRYRQKVKIGAWFSIEAKRRANGKWDCKVSNLGPYRLKKASIFVRDLEHSIDDLGVGMSKTYTFADIKSTKNQQGGIAEILTRFGGIALTGEIQGFRPGPQLGNEVEDRTSVRMALVAKEEAGAK